jgi:hypothetical protein
MGYTRIENLGGRGRSQRGAFGRVILVGAVPGPMGHYLRTSVSRCSPRRSHPGHWGPGSRLGPWDGARGGPEGRGERGRQLAAGGSWEVAMEGDFGDGRWWGIGARRRARRGMGVGVGVGRWRWRARAQGVAAAARTGNHSPVGAGGGRSRQLAARQRRQGRQSTRGGRYVLSA